MAGAGAYSRLTRRDGHAYDVRTALQYVAARVAQAPGPHRVTVCEFGGLDALTVSESIGGEDYITRVYCYDGWLMELFCAADGQFAPRDGEQLLRADGLKLELRDKLLYVSLARAGETHELVLYLEQNEEVRP